MLFKNKRIIPFMVILLLVFSGCAEKPLKKPGEKVSATESLNTKAKEFFLRGNNREALIIYNHGLAVARRREKVSIMKEIEDVLAKTSTSVIEDFLETEKLKIPRSLFLYWLGSGYFRDREYTKARLVLEDFTEDYSNHPYYSKAETLLADIKKNIFKRSPVGCLLPLSGKYATFGQRALTGIQMAMKDLSERHSHKFRVVIRDTESDPNRAAKCVSELNSENVSSIVGPLMTAWEAGREAEELKIPIIAMTQKTDFSLQGDYLFSNFMTPQMQVQTLVSYAFRELGIKKVAILYPDEKYGEKYMDLFWNTVDRLNGEVVGVESYGSKDTDFAEQIQKLTGQFYLLPDFLKPEPSEEFFVEEYDFYSEEEPEEFFVEEPEDYSEEEPEEEKIEIDFEALFIPDSPSKVNMILPHLVFNDVKGIYLLGTNLWHDKRLLTETRGYNENTIITDGYFIDSKNLLTADFGRRFKDLFGREPGFIEAIAYDNASILFKTSMDEDVCSRQTLKDALQGSRIFEGVTGTTVFDKHGRADKELFLITIKRGKFSEIIR